MHGQAFKIYLMLKKNVVLLYVGNSADGDGNDDGGGSGADHFGPVTLYVERTIAKQPPIGTFAGTKPTVAISSMTN